MDYNSMSASELAELVNSLSSLLAEKIETECEVDENQEVTVKFKYKMILEGESQFTTSADCTNPTYLKDTLWEDFWESPESYNDSDHCRLEDIVLSQIEFS